MTTGTRAAPRSGWPWIGLVAFLLLLSVGIQVTALVLAGLDPSFAIEPDYEERAAHYDDVLRQRAENARLGWSLALSASGAQPGRMDIELQLTDRAQRPIDGAAIDVVAYHLARSARRFEARAAGEGDGRYGASIPATRSGIWVFEVTALADGRRFTAELRRSVLCAPRARGAAAMAPEKTGS